MTIFALLLAVGMLVLGVLALVFSQQAGLFFCRMGKASWRMSTFGLTDMRWFYREERASNTGRRLGLLLCIMGFFWGAIAVLALSGPNSFAAMSQAQSFLKGKYGGSLGYSFTCKTTADPRNLIVHYKYGGKEGDLVATWDGKAYQFAEKP